MKKKKLISISSSCYNEEGNLWELYDRVTKVMDKFPKYEFEYLLADNGSTDHTQDVLRAIAAKDQRFKIIINAKNFGPSRSGYNLLRETTGDCVVSIVSDLQEPPEVIEDFIKKWEDGSMVVVGVKVGTKENPLKYLAKRFFYNILHSVSDVEMIDRYSGFGLLDRVVFDQLVAQDWPIPYVPGLVAEFGFDIAEVPYRQEKRKYGKSSYNFSRLFDYAMRSVTGFSKAPMRFATIAGMFISILSLVVAILYFILKLIFWPGMPMGIAPLIIGLFFFSSVQILFIGLIGEYVVQILEHVRKKTLVIESERINFGEK